MLEKVSNNLVKVSKGKKEYYILGTAHISKESVIETENLIKTLKPKAVAVELCKERYRKIEFKEEWLNTNIADLIRDRKYLVFMLNVVLSSYQKSLGEQVGVMPGSEFTVAAKLAKEKDIPLYLVDRDIGITLKRAFDTTSLWHKIKIFFTIMYAFFTERIDASAIEELKKEDMLSKALTEFSNFSPSLKTTLIDERNVYIASKTAKISEDRVLLIVGAGHRDEVASMIDKELTSDDLSYLETFDKSKSNVSILSWSLLIFFFLMLFYTLLAKGIMTLSFIVLLWILITGSFAAIGSAIGGASFVGILTAFFASPIAVIHPLIASGWIVGLVEIKKQNPTISDFFEINNVRKLSDFRHNKVLRIFLIVGLTNLGASIGSFLAFPIIIAHIL